MSIVLQSVLSAFHMAKPEDYVNSFRLILCMQTLDKYQEQCAEVKAQATEATAQVLHLISSKCCR